MTSDYISAIRKTQPEGPYCLMGWSTGGIFAYEIARRFQLDDVPVQSLIMLDSPQPSVFQDVDLSDNARFLTDMVNFANYFSGTSMKVDYLALREKSEEDALAMVLQMAQRERVLPPETTIDYLRRLITVCKQHVRLLQAYRPKPCDLAVHLIRPEDTSMLTEATGQRHDDDFGWGPLVDLHTHQVPGHHFTMLTGENAKALASTVGNLLSDPEFTQLSR
jgi:myxalamid-type polyketide synthase MxaB